MVNSPQTWLFERGLQRAGRRPLDCEPKGRRVADRGTDGFLDSKNRRDHIVPQVYLRGFIHPQRDQKQGPLEVFHLASNTWGLPQTPDDLCIEVGFYDYSVDRAETTADDAFRELEEGFFAVRERLRRDRFTDWTRERRFLIKFGVMLAVRSKRFREGLIASVSRQPAFRVVERDGTKLRVEPFELGTEPDAPSLLKNRSITDMRSAIEEGAAEWNGWTWGLRLAPSVDCPFVTSDHPPVMSGEESDRDRAYRNQGFRPSDGTSLLLVGLVSMNQRTRSISHRTRWTTSGLFRRAERERS